MVTIPGTYTPSLCHYYLYIEVICMHVSFWKSSLKLLLIHKFLVASNFLTNKKTKLSMYNGKAIAVRVALNLNLSYQTLFSSAVKCQHCVHACTHAHACVRACVYDCMRERERYCLSFRLQIYDILIKVKSGQPLEKVSKTLKYNTWLLNDSKMELY